MDLCDKCKKETLILFDCRCGRIFCIKHKDDIQHNCKFDYHHHEKNKLNGKKIKFNTKINLI